MVVADVKEDEFGGVHLPEAVDSGDFVVPEP